MQVNRTRSIISLFYLMFVCVGVCSLLEAAVAMFNSGGPSMYATFVVAAVIFGKINVHDVFRFRTRLPEGTALEEKEIDKVVEETALSLYLNFIGMIFVADFMKFVVKLLAETPKNAFPNRKRVFLFVRRPKTGNAFQRGFDFSLVFQGFGLAALFLFNHRGRRPFNKTGVAQLAGIAFKVFVQAFQFFFETLLSAAKSMTPFSGKRMTASRKTL